MLLEEMLFAHRLQESQSSRPLINPIFAQLQSMLLRFFLAVKGQTLDLFDPVAFDSTCRASDTSTLTYVV
jgi:hypothetical protein